MDDVWMTNNGWQPSLLFELRHLGFVIFIDPGVLHFARRLTRLLKADNAVDRATFG